jgi:hypothetical protein
MTQYARYTTTMREMFLFRRLPYSILKICRALSPADTGRHPGCTVDGPGVVPSMWHDMWPAVTAGGVVIGYTF